MSLFPESVADRLAQLRRYAAHYRQKAGEPYYVTGDRDVRNPWAGLLYACEREVARLEAKQAKESACATNETSAASTPSRKVG